MTSVFISLNQKENFWPGTYSIEVEQSMLSSSKELFIRLKPKTMDIDTSMTICVNRAFLWLLMKNFVKFKLKELRLWK